MAEAPATVLTLEALRENSQVQAFIRAADAQLGTLGYTEHGFRHVNLVASISQNILLRLRYPQRRAELAAISGYLHDIGNLVNRHDHAVAGALLSRDLLIESGVPLDELAIILGAIGNHEERVGEPISDVSAAIIIADKSDVHRSRVRNPNPAMFDIHDRVNYASQHSFVRVDGEARSITLEITIDTSIATIVDYFEIFLRRMLFIKKAAQFLDSSFELQINRQRLL
ncbi:MAG TPA: HD domain-containing protein [Chloroflexota bacterium]|nr:HD domain-containing protein [Chloroflexota bacterium]